MRRGMLPRQCASARTPRPGALVRPQYGWGATPDPRPATWRRLRHRTLHGKNHAGVSAGGRRARRIDSSRSDRMLQRERPSVPRSTCATHPVRVRTSQNGGSRAERGRAYRRKCPCPRKASGARAYPVAQSAPGVSPAAIHATAAVSTRHHRFPTGEGHLFADQEEDRWWCRTFADHEKGPRERPADAVLSVPNGCGVETVRWRFRFCQPEMNRPR